MSHRAFTERRRAGIIYPAEHTTTSPHLAIRRVDGPVAAELTGIAVDLVVLQSALDDNAEWGQALALLRETVTPSSNRSWRRRSPDAKLVTLTVESGSARAKPSLRRSVSTRLLHPRRTVVA